MLDRMFVVTEAEATAIRDALHQHGEFAAAIELRRLFPGITDNRQARECARTIAGWSFGSKRDLAQRAVTLWSECLRLRPLN